MFKEIHVGGVDKTAEVREFMDAIGLDRVAAGRYSSFFAVQLYCQWAQGGPLPIGRVIAEIEALENPEKASATKPPVRFNRAPLKGLWHKHHPVHDLSSMATNLLNALNKYGLPKLQQKVNEAEASGEVRFFEVGDIAEIAQEAVEENYERRYDAGEMTGEWIVYAIHEGQNYYLCFGTHKSGDEALRQQIDLTCVPEFPFLTEILAPVK